ncbi:hypothetical protein QE152_g4743 [Popillia japonica]|uniref:Zinc finger BED domain-containing protein 4 n=1 Tax=Popillia japonica TaxID=7064 RepID=A0AAW1MU32_POPJA
MILDVKTRWNSMYYMLERFLQLLPMVSNILFSDFNAPNMITAAEIEHLREICKNLKPLERMTVEISGENYPTIGKLIPMIGCLIDQYNNYLHRFGAIKKSYIPAVSTTLDPRFKQIYFRDPQAMGTVMSHIKCEIPTVADVIYFRDPQAMGTVMSHIKCEIPTVADVIKTTR